MTPDEALGVMNAVADTWANFEPGENTAVMWAMKLANVDVRDAQAAVLQLAGTDDWAPSIARVLTAARGIASSRATTPALGAAPNPSNARVIAAITAASAAVKRPAHEHRHKPIGCPCGKSLSRADYGTEWEWRIVSVGWEHCPACTTKQERIASFEADVKSVLREAGVIR